MRHHICDLRIEKAHRCIRDRFKRQTWCPASPTLLRMHLKSQMRSLAHAGTLPKQWSSLPLVTINLRNNSASGAEPAQPCAKCCRLFLRWPCYVCQHFNHSCYPGPRLRPCAGALPPEWASLPYLQELLLGSNGLTGPHALCSCPHTSRIVLRVRWLASQGALPSRGMGCGCLRWLTCRSAMARTAPGCAGVLHAVQAIAHTGMVLPGELPSAWSSMPLQVLDVTNNSLSGKLPSWLPGHSRSARSN